MSLFRLSARLPDVQGLCCLELFVSSLRKGRTETSRLPNSCVPLLLPHIRLLAPHKHYVHSPTMNTTTLGASSYCAHLFTFASNIFADKNLFPRRFGTQRVLAAPIKVVMDRISRARLSPPLITLKLLSYFS